MKTILDRVSWKTLFILLGIMVAVKVLLEIL